MDKIDLRKLNHQQKFRVPRISNSFSSYGVLDYLTNFGILNGIGTRIRIFVATWN